MPNMLGERYYITFTLWHEPSVCRLSVKLLPVPRGLKFSAIFLHRLIDYGVGKSVLIFKKNILRGLGDRVVKRKERYNIGVFRPTHCCISKTIPDTAIEDE